ncbi:hypothetical protein GKE82_17470 [Conexibacter sp. W3-3-2]|nr:hypothetical protein [Conexibacter sp. W3-3-2]
MEPVVGAAPDDRRARPAGARARRPAHAPLPGRLHLPRDRARRARLRRRAPWREGGGGPPGVPLRARWTPRDDRRRARPRLGRRLPSDARSPPEARPAALLTPREPAHGHHRRAVPAPGRVLRRDGRRAGRDARALDAAGRALRGLGTAALLDRRAEAARLLDQDGVVYHAYEDQRSDAWLLDPLPTVLTSREWLLLEAGLIERAELLNLVLEDLYGARDLLRRGIVPPEVVYGHDGFLRACDGIRLPGTQQLFSYAADLGRDASGAWVVVSDRAQAPSGFGYALENRLVVSRVLPSLYRDAHVHRLAPFFRQLRTALQEAAPPGVDDPRIVVLSPGPWNETAFEHGILASTLGYPLVEGADLTVRRDGVWMRSLGRLEPVHVILRRVDGDSCDPLELRADSLLGVPGLVEASRRGVVSVVNTLGSSALENPALLAYLPRISRHLLGRELRLPTVPSWWCGDEDGRAEVLARLDELVVRPLSRGAGSATVFGWELSNHELEELRARIEARPGAWVGQERVITSSTPTLTDDGLVARRSLLRSFAVARNDSYAVMPGGSPASRPTTATGASAIRRARSPRTPGSWPASPSTSPASGCRPGRSSRASTRWRRCPRASPRTSSGSAATPSAPSPSRGCCASSTTGARSSRAATTPPGWRRCARCCRPSRA